MSNLSTDSILEKNMVPSDMDQSAGMIIKSARVDFGMTIEQLSGILKVSPKKIEALEENRWADVGDAVFIRGLGSSIAKHLKIDPPGLLLSKLPLVTQLPKFDEQLMAGQTNKGISFEEPSKQKYLHLVGVFIVLSLIMVFIPDAYLTKEKWKEIALNIPLFNSKKDAISTVSINSVKPSTELKDPVQTTEQTQSTTSPVNQPIGSPSSTTVTEIPIPAPALPSNPLNNSEKPLVDSNSISPIAPIISTGSTNSVNPNNSANTTSSPQVSSNEMLVISATESSWVEIKDNQGQSKLQRLLNKGEVVGISGGLPYSVVIGRSDLVSVQFQGKPFDMTPYAKNNVARFQLK